MHIQILSFSYKGINRYLTLGWLSSLHHESLRFLAILCVLAVGDFPQGLDRSRHRLFSQFFQLLFQLLNLGRVSSNYLFYLGLTLLVVLIQILVYFLQFSNHFLLLSIFFDQSLFFNLKMLMSSIQDLNHFLDFFLIPLNIEDILINMILLPLQQFLVLELLLGKRLLKERYFLLVTNVQVFDSLSQVQLVLLELLNF